MLKDNLLSLLIFLPAVGALILLPMRDRKAIRWATLATTIVVFLLSLLLLAFYDFSGDERPYAYKQEAGLEERLAGDKPEWSVKPNGVVQLVHSKDWIPALNVKYKVGVDGLSIPLVPLSTFICVLAAIASW